VRRGESGGIVGESGTGNSTVAGCMDEQDFHTILDKFTAPTELEIFEALSPSELSALVHADSTVADLTQEVDARIRALITARRADVIATVDLAGIIARINKRREWKEANPDPFEDANARPSVAGFSSAGA
jgi:cytidylate kinase